MLTVAPASIVRVTPVLTATGDARVYGLPAFVQVVSEMIIQLTLGFSATQKGARLATAVAKRVMSAAVTSIFLRDFISIAPPPKQHG